MTEKELYKFLKAWINKWYGESEASDPCYNIKKLAKDLAKELNKRGQAESILLSLNPHQYLVGRSK